MKYLGFGVSVIQRLCKTSVKKNLYWEIKDKVIEEAYNGVRIVKKSQKVRVYGTDSTKEVRARLIEILYDRVEYHKAKFVAPILHKELQGMEVKKNGKVEHSDNTHDDQVFSYLMALYVWYDGKDLAEKFHIVKNTLKTDEGIDMETLDVDESNATNHTNVDLTSISYEPESEASKAMEFLEKNSKPKTSKDLREEYYDQVNTLREIIFASNKDARNAYCKSTGVDPSMYNNPVKTTYVALPDTLFMDTDLMLDDEDKREHAVLTGNLSDIWDKV